MFSSYKLGSMIMAYSIYQYISLLLSYAHLTSSSLVETTTGGTTNVTNQSNTTVLQPYTRGWTPSPNGRGTADIIWSCTITMFLCSWSVLCLQVPSQTDTRLALFVRRWWLTALCVLGPEFTLQLALGQWSAARKSVRDFRDAGFQDWSIKHAFYANSGGFILYTTDFKPIPLNEQQLLYLIKKRYVKYPTITTQAIDDKNKVDVLLRLISLLQILWFTSSLIARAVQGLVITAMELTTAAFILCSLGTTFCWWNKGADVTIPDRIHSSKTMREIISDAQADGMYHRTPLDFISRQEWHWSLYWTHWINILRKMHIVFAPKALPHDRIENTLWLDLTARGSMVGFMLMCFAYSAIFMAAWNDYFPTTIEQVLWRISSLSMMGAVILYFVVTGFAYLLWPALERYTTKKEVVKSIECAALPFKNDTTGVENVASTSHGHSSQSSKKTGRFSSLAARIRNNSTSKDPALSVPLKATLPMYLVGFFYCVSRTSIFVLDIIQLRSMPPSAYETVEWSAFVPHLGS